MYRYIYHMTSYIPPNRSGTSTKASQEDSSLTSAWRKVRIRQDFCFRACRASYEFWAGSCVEWVTIGLASVLLEIVRYAYGVEVFGERRGLHDDKDWRHGCGHGKPWLKMDLRRISCTKASMLCSLGPS